MSGTGGADSASRRRAWAVFAILAIASLGLLTVVDGRVWSLAMRYAPPFAFLGRDRIASLTVCAILCRAVGGRDAFRLPVAEARWRLVAKVVGLWLAGTIFVVLVLKAWTPTRGFRAHHDYIAFLGTGLVGEELLFRGALYAAASRVFKDSPAVCVGPVVWATAVFFALAHLQYHGFRPTSAAALQVALTLPMGLVFGIVRKHTGSVWPGVGVHLANNLVSVAHRVLMP